MRLSLCMIVRNEAALLRRCLRSVRSVIDEIIVADTGSTDDTVTVAHEFGAKVVSSPWADDFSRARNSSLAAASGRWILVLDADEQLMPDSAPALSALLDQHDSPGTIPATAFELILNNSSDGGRTGMLASIIRLFPNRPEVRFEWPIHEQVATSIRRAGISVCKSSIQVLHDGYSDPARNQAKQARNRALLQAQVAAAREVCPLTHYLLGGANLDLGDHEAALANYRECQNSAAPGDGLAAGASIRVATCLHKLGRHAELEAQLPLSRPLSDWHPELLLLRGHCLRARGLWLETIESYCSVLDCKDAVFMPPCNLYSTKMESIVALATLLKSRGLDALSVSLLRSAVSRHQQGLQLCRNWIAPLLAGLPPKS